MRAHECYHCKQWVEDGEPHDCWTTTEAAFTSDLPDDLREAWARLREWAVELGDQRIYASHHSIMFSRRSCFFFVRPKARFLEVCVFLGRAVTAPQVHRVVRASRTRLAHLVRITHRDQIEPPLTDWIREAYRLQDRPAVTPPDAQGKGRTARPRRPVAKQTTRAAGLRGTRSR